jgi:hypothetical protein
LLLRIFGDPYKQKIKKIGKKRKYKKLKEMLEENKKNTYQLKKTYQNA